MGTPEEKPLDLSNLNAPLPASVPVASPAPGNFFKNYHREIRIFLISAGIGLFFMFPRIYLARQISADLTSLLQRFFNFRPNHFSFQIPALAQEPKTKPPFQTAARAPVPGGLRLDGFAGNTSVTSAVINGDVFEIGQEVNGYRLAAIQDGTVRLVKEGQRYSLSREGGLRAEGPEAVALPSGGVQPQNDLAQGGAHG